MGEIFPGIKKPKNILTLYKLYYNKHCISFLLVIAFIILSISGNAVTYYVSSTGNDINSGTSESLPWRTLTKVNNFYKLYPGDQILFKRGDEWTGSLTINASGRVGTPIVYGAYGVGDKPKIYGSKVISGWTLHTGNIYKTSYATDISQLFVDGKKMKLARLTNTGYNTVNSVTSQTKFTCNALDAGFNYTGARVMLRTENWYSIMRTVTSSSSKTLTINSAPAGTIKVNQGFLLMNKLEFLDSPGEWYYDTASKMVYLWPPNGDSPANYEIRGSVETNGVYNSGKSYITIQDLHILQQKETGIYLASNGGISFTNVIIQRNSITGQEGVGIWDESNINQYLTIQNNDIDDCNGIGIYTWIANSVIRDNTILNIGAFDKLGLNGTWNDNGGTGMEISGNGNTIEYNRIIGVNYNGIFWRGSSVLQYNFVKNACLYKSDGGGIYTGGITAAGSNVRYNIIDNVIGNKDGGITGRNMGEGIYLDEPSLNISCENNTVVRCSNSGIFLHKVENHTILHNTIMDARYGVLVVQSTGTVKSNITNNIIVPSSAIDDYEPRQLAVCFSNGNVNLKNNIYSSPFENDHVFKYSDNSYKNFSNWKNIMGEDLNSIFLRNTLDQDDSQKLFYNDTKQTKTYNLGNSVFRDIYGKPVKDTFMLKPFTSKILIGKNFKNINQNPSILDQSFNFIAPKRTNDFIGQVIANDPDSGQTISYFIVQGNEKGWFAINSTTGGLYAKTDIQTSKDKSVELVVQVTDNAINSLTQTAKVSINITGTDISPPNFLSFSVPSQAITLTVPVLTFTAEDDLAVTGYLLTETSKTPLATDNLWSTTVPANFTFSGEGVMTLYAWAKDSAGNISGSVSSTVTIALPDMSPTFSAYLFEESEGKIIIDTNGRNNGTIVNEGFRDKGVIGNGLALTGSAYINIGQAFGENVQNEVTLSAWIKPGSVTGNYQGIIMHGGPNTDTYALYINPEYKSIGFKTSGTTNEWVALENVNNLWDGNWHHIVAIYNGKEKVIYFDNVLLVKVDARGEIDSGWKYNLLIGAGRDELTPTLLYNGSIDEVRIYNYALNGIEIGKLYHPVNRIIKKTATTEDISICKGEKYMGFYETGKYERTLQRALVSASGADSIVTTNLWVYPVYNHFDNATICHGDIYTFGTQKLYETGEYTETFKSVNGCDSTVILTLTVLPENIFTYNISICEGQTYTFESQTLSISGEYTQINKSINGCDSTVILKLTVNPNYKISEDITIYSTENYFGWNREGTYQRKLISSAGCDSMVITNLKVDEILTQKINLEKGWNIFSSRLIPTNGNMESVMNILRLEEKLVKILDEDNNTYEKSETQTDWNNNIGKLKPTEGYKIKVIVPCVLEIKGQQIQLPLGIELKKGLNLISFPVIGSADAMQTIEPLISAGILEKIQDEKGNAIENWDKMGWINGIGNFTEGEGYIVQVNESGKLMIDRVSEKTSQILTDSNETIHFKVNYEGNGFEHMNINIAELNKTQLIPGDEIAVFDNNICVGAVKLNNKHFTTNAVSIPASALDGSINNGFTDGHSVVLKVWHNTTKEEVKLLPEVIKGKLIYTRKASVFIKFNEESDFTENIFIYPNPAKSIIKIRFSSLPEDGAKILLLDITGKQILTRQVQSNIEIINVENLAPGMYFIKTFIKNKLINHKLMIT